MCCRSSELVSNGLPFLIDALTVEGSVTGKEAATLSEYLEGRPVHLDSSENGPKTEQMLLSSTVYGFKAAQP